MCVFVNIYFFEDPNQLIRASALRVLSSIRVPMIAPIMLLAIRESVRDMSAYVRKVISSLHEVSDVRSQTSLCSL